LAAIVAADIAGYSTLMGADEPGTVRDLKAHQAVVLPMIADHGGRIIDTAGDGILAEFASVVNAVECAVAIQKIMAERNAVIDPTQRMQFRIGINVGDVVYDDARVYGDGVNVAARLESIAEPGGICISEKVHQEIRAKIDLRYRDVGPQQLKNIAEPVRVYRIELAQLTVSGPQTKAPLALPDKPSIAVLPFTNLSGDPQQEYFADGMVDEITMALSRLRWLFVIARNSSFTYKGRAVDVKHVGQELGVRYVLEGSVRKAANQVRIAGQLIDALTGAQLWAERFDGTLENIFDLQDQVAKSVVGAIGPKMQQAEMERAKRKPTESLDAYDYLLRGMSLMQGVLEEEGNREALRLFYKAIELDPEFSLAHATAAWCYVVRKASGWVTDRDQDVVETARLVRRAVALGRDDALSLCFAGFALAYVVGELNDGIAFIDEACALNPNLASAWYFRGWTRIWNGEPEKAIEHTGYAMRLSPLDPFMFQCLTVMAHACVFLGRYDEAVPWVAKALRERPNSRVLLRIAAASFGLTGRETEAKKAVTRLQQLDPGLRVSNLRDVLGPYRRPEDLTRYAEGLRIAGLPE
jgi:TolB-like protein